MTDEALPEPLVPAEVDLHDFGFMPLDVRRLLTSETWIEAADTPKVGHAVMCLWCESWHQIPCGSLPDNDRVLARLAMCDAKTWARIRAEVLKSWVKCSDGLLYHPVVAEKARGAWKEKLAQRARTKAATEAREARRRAEQEARDVQRNVERNVERDEHRNDERDVERNVQRDVSRDVHQGRGTGTGRVKGEGEGEGQGIVKTLSDGVAERPPPAAKAKANGHDREGRSSALFDAYALAYRRRYHVDPVRNAKVNAMLCSTLDRLGAEAPQVAAWYVAHNRADYVRSRHCVDLLARDAEGLRTEWATGRRMTETEARQADRTQANGDVFRELIEESRHAGK